MRSVVKEISFTTERIDEYFDNLLFPRIAIPFCECRPYIAVFCHDAQVEIHFIVYSADQRCIR